MTVSQILPLILAVLLWTDLSLAFSIAVTPGSTTVQPRPLKATATTMHDEEKVILLVGSCGLDRLLTVQKYPSPDAKVRTTAYHEVGGGNAANTASAIGKLLGARFLQTKIRVNFLSKVGADSVGQQLIDELQESNVDTDSPLFLRGPPGSTTAFTTVVVSSEEHTRTCIHTPGTCGELTLEDIRAVDLDDIFQNVVHLHSDSRHTEASLVLAKEAKKRGICVSCDCEKDRKTASLDELLQLSDILFTNSNYLGDYLGRLSSEKEIEHKRTALGAPSITGGTQDQDTINTYAHSLTPSAFFSRWYSQQDKEVVVTQGRKGSLHFERRSFSVANSEGCHKHELEFRSETGALFARHQFGDAIGGDQKDVDTEYRIRQAGILDNLNIVDTTGAGDAFIGGYLLTKLSCSSTDPIQFALQFGSWVAGRKLEGPGARLALPTARHADQSLGSTEAEVMENLDKMLLTFNNYG